MKAVYKGIIIAESDKTVLAENNHYFPPDTVHMEYLEKSENTYTCPWKGDAFYYDVVVDGDRVQDAAWVYPDPKDEARHLKGHIAFWKDIEVLE